MRTVLLCLVVNLLLAPTASSLDEVAATKLLVQRLTWAGVRLATQETTVLIDAVGTDLWNGAAPQGLVPVEASTRRRYALITHTHNDHFDPATLKRVLGEKGYVICHESQAAHIASRGLRVIAANYYEPVERGGFIFVAVPAVDGFGAEQVSWIVSHEGSRFLHAGDTLWHGKWSLWGQQYGPFDGVFLPVNGALVQQQPESEIAAVMTAEQAVNAAIQLSAQRLVPIHYGLIDPPFYVETGDPLSDVMKAGKRRGLEVLPLLPGENMDLN